MSSVYTSFADVTDFYFKITSKHHHPATENDDTLKGAVSDAVKLKFQFIQTFSKFRILKRVLYGSTTLRIASSGRKVKYNFLWQQG